MVWSAILKVIKSLVPESFIKIEDNRTIISFKGNERIIINGQEVKDQGKSDTIIEEIGKYKKEETLPFQVLHEDLKEDFLEYEQISIVQKESLILLKEILPLEELDCILMARRLHLAYKKDRKLAEELKGQLDKNFPGKGRKIFNLIDTGYFDELILPMINVLKSQYPTEYQKKFREFYYDLLRFFPTAVFVGAETSEEKIKEDLEKRLKLKTIPFIKIHSIGEGNIQKIDHVIENLEKTKKWKFSIQDDRFTTPSGLIAQTVTIKILKNYC